MSTQLQRVIASLQAARDAQLDARPVMGPVLGLRYNWGCNDTLDVVLELLEPFKELT